MRRLGWALVLLSTFTGMGANCNGDMTTDRLVALAADAKDVESLLDSLPEHMRMNFTLMEDSGGLQPASREHPRLVHFGSDARFILAVSTDPEDPNREVLEFTELDTETGGWNFQTLDLRASPPIRDEPAVCKTCHGAESPRPIWGTYPDWPGSFSPTEGSAPTELAERFNLLRDEPGDRFGHLIFPKHPLRPGTDIMSVAGRGYAFTNTVFNFELGPAVALGMFTRMKSHPRYEALRAGFFLLRRNCSNQRSAAHERVIREISALGLRADVAGIYEALDLPIEIRALDRTALAPPSPERAGTWSSGESSLEDFIEFLVLDDLIKDFPELAETFAAREGGGFGARPGSTVEEDRRERMQRLFRITGELRQRDRQVSQLELGRVEAAVLNRAEGDVCRVLMKN